MTSKIVWNIVLGILWIFLTANYTLFNLLVGLILGLAALTLSGRIGPGSGYLSELITYARLITLFLRRVFQANIILAKDILFRPGSFDHAFLAIDVSRLGPVQKVVLGYMISLTPGTLVLDYGNDNNTLYVHSLYGAGIENTRMQVEEFATLLTKDRPRPMLGKKEEP